MVHSRSVQSERAHDAFDDFREITQSLMGLDAEGQVPFLKYELLQALERATELQGRSQDLEHQLEELQNRIEADRPAAVAGRTASELAAVKARYEERLETVEGAYRAMKRRCVTLEEWCRSLLVTIEQAACREGAGDVAIAEPPLAWASPNGEPASRDEPIVIDERELVLELEAEAAQHDESRPGGYSSGGVAPTEPMEAP
jgi:hypothetical protein